MVKKQPSLLPIAFCSFVGPSGIGGEGFALIIGGVCSSIGGGLGCFCVRLNGTISVVLRVTSIFGP